MTYLRHSNKKLGSSSTRVISVLECLAAVKSLPERNLPLLSLCVVKNDGKLALNMVPSERLEMSSEFFLKSWSF